MRELFDKIRNDKGLQELITKALSAKANGTEVNLLERREAKWGTAINLVNYYKNWEDYEKFFNDAVRARCGNRLLAYNGNNSYRFITDIADGADEKKCGHWVIMGYGAEKPETKEPPFICKEFAKIDELHAEEENYLKQIDQWAVIHQYGTTNYIMVKTTMLSGDAKPDLITEGIDPDLEEIKKAAGTWQRKLEETEGPISDVGPALDI